MTMILSILILFFIIRLLFLSVSIKHEEALIAKGAKQLVEIWTVKIYILPEHQINRSWLFKTFRHPNYFLNIIPELIGIALLCQAWYVLLIGLPIYLLVLFKRIRQEEQAMATLF